MRRLEQGSTREQLVSRGELRLILVSVRFKGVTMLAKKGDSFLSGPGLS